MSRQVKTKEQKQFEANQRSKQNRKVNNALLFYLLTECKEYTILVSETKTSINHKEFFYVDKILKENKIC